MELVDGDSESPTLISNIEVMQLLQKNIEARAKKDSIKKGKKRPNKQFRHRDWVEEEVHKYLESTPCVKLDPDRREEFYSKLRGSKKLRQKVATKQEESISEEQQQDTSSASVPTGYNLTEAEALQIMNMMPSEPVEIHLMIDELQARMSDERQDLFLGFIASYCKDGALEAASSHDGEAMEVDEGETNGGMGQNGKEYEEENGKPRAVQVKQEVESGQTGVI